MSADTITLEDLMECKRQLMKMPPPTKLRVTRALYEQLRTSGGAVTNDGQTLKRLEGVEVIIEDEEPFAHGEKPVL